jgi:hypothetical protein
MTGSQNRESFTPGQMRALQSGTQGGSRMPELGPYGSVRGARGNSRPYRDRDITRVVELVLDPPVLANGVRGMACIDRAVGQIE